jgi:hypothetical protein
MMPTVGLYMHLAFEPASAKRDSEGMRGARRAGRMMRDPCDPRMVGPSRRAHAHAHTLSSPTLRSSSLSCVANHPMRVPGSE